MASTDWDTIQIKEIPGKKKVTEEQKNATIEHAVKTWEGMELDPAQIAFGTAVMGHESGFDAKAEGTTKDSDEFGLGQFTEGTWKEAVKHYNDERRKPENSNWPAVDPVKGREDHDSQIQVMGPWIRKAWNRAGEIARDRNVKGYSQEQIAYGKWNQGQNKSAKGVGDYLKENWFKSDIGGYFDVAYDRAKQGLSLRKQRGSNQ